MKVYDLGCMQTCNEWVAYEAGLTSQEDAEYAKIAEAREKLYTAHQYIAHSESAQAYANEATVFQKTEGIVRDQLRNLHFDRTEGEVAARACDKSICAAATLCVSQLVFQESVFGLDQSTSPLS